MLTGLPTALTTRLALMPEPRSVDLWTFTSVSGTTYRWCDGPLDRTWSGNTWLSHQAAIIRGDCDAAAGDQDNLEIDSLDLTITADDAAQTVAGLSFDAAVLAGQLGGAEMHFHRLFLADDGTQLGAIEIFGGLVQQVEPNVNEVKLVVKSYLALGGGDLAMGSSVSSDWMLSVGCPFSFGDANCGVSASVTAGTVGGIIIPSGSSLCAGITFPTASAWTALCVAGSVITFTSGPLAGRSVTVRSAQSSGGTTSVYFSIMVLPVPAAGNTFNVKAVCAKTYAACITFSNLRRFGGFPWIPDNATDLIEA